MDFKHILHNRWFLYGGGLLLLVVLFMHLKGSNAAVGNGVTTSTTIQPTDAQVQAQSSLALAQIQGNLALAQAQIGAAQSANTTTAQVTVATQTLQEQLAEKGLDASVAKYSIDAGLQSQTMQIQAASIAQERDDNLQASIAKWTLDQAAAVQANNNNFQLAYAAQANSTTIGLGQIVAGVNLASIQANRDVTIAGFQAQAAQTASLIGGQVAMNDSNNSVAIAKSNNDTKATIHGQTTGMVGGIVGSIAGIFSDRRLKRDARLIGRDADGLGRYAYRYHGDASYQVGVMADEVRRFRPQAMGARVAGYDTVRYAAL